MVSLNVNKCLSYLLVFLLAALSFPLIPGWIPQLQKAWIVLMILMFVYLILSQRVGWGKSTMWLMAYSIVLFLNAKTGDVLFPSVQIAIVEVLFLYVPSAIALWCIIQGKEKLIKTILIVSLSFFLIEAVCSFILLQTEPGIIRNLYKIATDEGDSSLMYRYYKMGLLDYFMAHAVPILIPPLFYAYKKLASTIKLKILYGAAIAVCLFLTWLSDSTTALMVAVMFIIMGAFTNLSGCRGNVRKLSAILLLSLPIMASDDVQLATLDVAEGILGSESVFAEKIHEFRFTITNEAMTGDIQGRVDRYNKSLMMFAESPIWGANTKPGNHAALIDRLGSLGLLGFIPLILFFFHIFRIYTTYLSHDSIPFYYEGILAAFIILTTKGMWVCPMFFNLFILLPFILYYIDNKAHARY